MNNTVRIIFIIVFSLLIYSCKEDKPTPPVITTANVSEISYNEAISGGIVIDEGGATINSRGVIWNTSPTVLSLDVVLWKFKTTESGTIGAFSSTLSNLSPNTLYYVSAYATNSTGTGFGDQVSFTTAQAPLPTVTTTKVTDVTQNSALSGGNIPSDYIGEITKRGICYGTTANPDINSFTKTDVLTGTGAFTSHISGLTANTEYYVRAFATISAGTSYGNEIAFKTIASLPSIRIVEPLLSITQTTAVCHGSIDSDGGATITAAGVCWSTSEFPTINDNKSTDVSGLGSFDSNINGLVANTTYYLRGFASNSSGTAYSNQITFRTLPIATVPIVSTTSFTIISDGYNYHAEGGGNVASDGNSIITEMGVYWGTSQNPETTGSKLVYGSGSGSGLGSFLINLSKLSPNVTYYVKAYAINSAGTGFGDQISFTTPPRLAIVATLDVDIESECTVVVRGYVDLDGGTQVTDKGYCWSTLQNPTVEGNKISRGHGGIGPFSGYIVGLEGNTTYYIRTFAVNSVGIAYGIQKSITTSKLDPLIDADGNIYKTTTYETMTWMTENLKTTKYNDGSLIPEVTDRIAWSNQTSPAFCWYNNDSSTYKDSFGALYNSYSVNTGKLCPIGWHVSTYYDWSILVDILSRNSYGFDGGISTNVAKSLASKVGWQFSETVGAPGNNPNSNNLSGFTGIPTGLRFMEGYFLAPMHAIWWIWNGSGSSLASSIDYSFSVVEISNSLKDYGFSVRCVKY